MRYLYLLRKISFSFIFITYTALHINYSSAQDKPANNVSEPSWPDHAPVWVNGTKITPNEVDELVKITTSLNMTPETEELRKKILEDLIIKEVILQDAKKTHLMSQRGNEIKVRLAAAGVIVQLWYEQYFAAHPILENTIIELYNQESSRITQDPINANEYKLAQIIVNTELQAIAVIDRLQNGGSFVLLAKEISLDTPSGVRGGDLGWHIPSQLNPNLKDLVLKMDKQQFTLKPIPIADHWVVIKVSDIRPFSYPSYEIIKPQLIQELIERNKSIAVITLLKGAKIDKSK